MSLHAHIKPIVYGTLNVGVGCGIVFANKAVLSIFNFKFVYCLTLIHTIVTMVGMWMFAAGGIFEIKRFTAMQVAPLAAAFVGYVVFWNLSLQVNSVGFYQLSKIMVLPTVAALECLVTKRRLTRMECSAIALVVIGVVLATVTDSTVMMNMLGCLLSGAAILFSAVYQVWIGTKQKELEAGSMQLMHQYTPWATGLLAILVPIFEPVGFVDPNPGTILGFNYTFVSTTAILGSAVLGLLVSWSTFLMIGATSGLTFNVIGHLKLIIVLAGGVAFFGDQMPPKKLAGVCVALAGIAWYSFQGLQKKQPTPAAKAVDVEKSVPLEEKLPLVNGTEGRTVARKEVA
ncbi:g13065 [Coccomyxa viridis]|uniref:G13065 protein n=1 Tax=Coccomyxa viridis TaxID=1274662 RepID=A0ABP1GJ11_9CHLO